MAKGNDGTAARRRTLRKLSIAAAISLVVTFLIVSRGSSGTQNEPGHAFGRMEHNRRRHLPEGLNGGVHGRSGPDDDAGGSGDDDASGSGDDRDLHDDGGKSPMKQRWKAMYGLAQHYRKELVSGRNSETREEVLDGILNGSVNLVDLVNVQNAVPSDDGAYEGVKGVFCKLDFSLHKNDPSNHPMFRFIVQKSPDCDSPTEFDLEKVAYLARMRDEEVESDDEAVPKVLNLTAVAFHESRCGSTLVANSMIAMDPEKHRTYSESSPPIKALHVCDHMGTCDVDMAVSLFKDTVYLMSRTDDHREERLFFKFQSATSTKISIFTKAFPDVPWMYVYRDPVQVMMSHVKDDPTMQHAICTKSRRHPPRDIEHIAQRHGRPNARLLEPAEYCAAHLAHLTESAVKNLNEMAIPVEYQQLPDILWEKIMPRIFGRELEDFEINNMKEISGVYSKGTNRGKQGEFVSDSEQKEKRASEEVRQAAKKFLTESFDQLAAFKPPLLTE